MSTKKLCQMGLLVGVAFVLGYLESLIPFNIGIPGVKIGFANLAVVIAMNALGYKEAFGVGIVRVILTGFTFGNMNSLMYSLAGSMLSLFIMVIMHKTKKFSIIGISIAGGLAHNMGQLIMASIILESLDLKYYTGFLMVCGAITGLLIGIISERVVSYLKKM